MKEKLKTSGDRELFLILEKARDKRWAGKNKQNIVEILNGKGD